MQRDENENVLCMAFLRFRNCHGQTGGEYETFSVK